MIMEMNKSERPLAEADITISSDDDHRNLYYYVRKEKWGEVVEIYERDRDAYKAKITESGYTALHLAVTEEEVGIVEALVGVLVRRSREEAKEALKIQNKRGHSPLHLAAATGIVPICQCMTNVDPTLLRIRDRKGRTPLYRAVQFGNIEAFLHLHHLLGPEDRLSCSKKENGFSILHNAIIREHFDLAFLIIKLYRELVNALDDQNDSPLHILARKPAAFKSGSRLRGQDKFIYNCISVKTLKQRFFSCLESRHHGIDQVGQSAPDLDKLCRVVVDRNQLNSMGREKGPYNTTGDMEKREEQYSSSVSKAPEHESSLECHRHFKDNFSSLFGKVFYMFASDSQIRNIRIEREKHEWAVEVLQELLRGYENSHPISINDEAFENHDKSEMASTIHADVTKIERKKESVILIAAKFGIVEMVKEILEHIPMAIHEVNEESKNVLLVAVENRHLEVFRLLLRKYEGKSFVLQKEDNHGNNALHYAATYGEHVKPWPVPGHALQMQREIKWHEYMERAMPQRLYLRSNKEGLTSKDVFSKTHKQLVEKGSTWLTNTANSCSLVAALIATVAFASITTVPGNTDNNSGKTTLENSLALTLFVVTSLFALCLSVTSLITFLAVLTSRHEERDFKNYLPRKLLLGLSTLFLSIAFMLAAFCITHFVKFEGMLKLAAILLYAFTLIPLFQFSTAFISLYVDLLVAVCMSRI